MSFCVSCGAPNPDSNRFCQHCGTMLQTSMPAGGMPMGGMYPGAMGNTPRTCEELGYNLMVDFMSSHPAVNMDISFQDWPEKHVLNNNENKVFMLNPGIHIAIIRIGNRAYKRNVTTSTYKPVVIHCSWAGKAKIDVV